MWELVFWDARSSNSVIGMFTPHRREIVLRDNRSFVIWDPRNKSKPGKKKGPTYDEWLKDVESVTDASMSEAEGECHLGLDRKDDPLEEPDDRLCTATSPRDSDCDEYQASPAPDHEDGVVSPNGGNVELVGSLPPGPPVVVAAPSTFFHVRLGVIDIQRAPSSRSKCALCAGKIEQRGLRLEVALDRERPARYQHVTCASVASTLNVAESLSVIQEARERDVLTAEEIAALDACVSRLRPSL